jgi:hypothetical protein
MDILSPPVVTTRDMTWSASSRTFIAVASDIGARFGRVYADAADEGLTLEGATGRRVVFVVNETERDRENDIMSWTLVPANLTDRAMNVTVRIFND